MYPILYNTRRNICDPLKFESLLAESRKRNIYFLKTLYSIKDTLI